MTLEFTNITSFIGRIEEYNGESDVDTISSGRIEIWAEIIGKIKESPIIGVGIGNTRNPHNEFLQTAAWHGVPAVLFYIAALGAMYVKAFVNRKGLTDTQITALGGTTGYIVSSFFGNGLLQTIPTYILILALCFNIELSLNNAQKEAENIAKKQQLISQTLPTNLDEMPNE